MEDVKRALLEPEIGIRDSALKCRVVTPLSGVGSSPFVQLSPVVTVDIEEPIRLLVSGDGREAGGAHHRARSRGAILCGGVVRPYTPEEARAMSSTEFACGKAIHTFVGHYRLVFSDGHGHHTRGHTCESNSDFLSSSRVSRIKEGPGALYFADGGFFVGHWSNNLRCRLGALYSALGYAYEGEWHNDQPHGRGVEHQHPSGVTYAGDFADGRPHGSGVMYYPRNGSLYVGEFARGEKHGCGVVFYGNGDVFEGRWVDGRRSGMGVSTSVASRKPTSVAADWHHDRCRVETLRVDPSYCKPSLQSYIDDDRVTPLDVLESPLGCGVAALLPAASARVQEVPPLLLRRLERCFDRLDEAHCGEVSAAVLEAAFDPHIHAEGPAVLREILRAAGGGAVDFVAFLHGFFPHLSAAEVQRLVLREVQPDALLRLRGTLAGIPSGRRDGFLHIADERATGGALLSGSALASAGGAIGGIRVPRGITLRLRARGTAERMTFTDLLERLYPAADPRAICRCEAVSITPPFFYAHARAFEELDDTQKGVIVINAMIIAERQFLSARARGHERIVNPANALERLIISGRRLSQAHWNIASIELSVTFAQNADYGTKGTVSLADVLRTAYPNIPCVLTRNRLSNMASMTKISISNGERDTTVDRVNTSDIEECTCCICNFCRNHALPLTANRGQQANSK